MAICRGVVLEVYEIAEWAPVGSAHYESRPMSEVILPGRSEFTRTRSAVDSCKAPGKERAGILLTRGFKPDPVCESMKRLSFRHTAMPAVTLHASVW